MSAARADLARAGRLALGGALAFALVEPILTVILAQGEVRFATFLRFLALDVTLALLLAALLWLVLGGVFLAARGVVRLVAGRERAAAWPGLLGPGPTLPREHVGKTPWGWAGVVGGLAYVAGSAGFTVLFLKTFKEPQLVAGSLALIQLGLFGVAALLVLAIGLGLRRGARALAPRLGAWNPLGRPLPALAAAALVALPAGALLVKKLPQLRAVAPWRELLAAVVIAVGVGLAVRLRWPQLARRVRVALAVGLLALAVVTLTWLGGDPETKYLATSASPPMNRLVDLVRTLNDFDRDGFGSLLGENDCAPFDKTRNPLAHDIPDNGIDENCNGRDGPLRRASAPDQVYAVPKEFQRDWNVVFITIDTVRYDHTTMGGSAEARKRDTTPRLAEFARRSSNFEFANAPSAGTMASMPALLTSKFFHSGIALGPAPGPHMPPSITADNTLLSEVLKRAGYVTGAITTHEYFGSGWLSQGFDTYDNELGAKPDPFGIKADKTTDKAQAWIAKHTGGKKWFLWVHYIDPHGRYVAHPGETSYGATEEDLYDGELRWTDKQIGRLLDFIERLPDAGRTIIVITSDHGDGFGEHGYINHGVALYWELLHVPLIFYVPDNEAAKITGPVSNLDIFPTLAALAGQDVSDLGIEGKSLIPQLFYGQDASDRVVFAETNIPEPQRAAVSDRYKLIYKLKSNVYELFDLKADPLEKKNIWGKDKAGGEEMKGHLDDWLDRVYFSRDGVRNQAHQQRAQAILAERPTPQRPLDVTLADGSIKLLGWDVVGNEVTPGAPLKLTLYAECLAAPKADYKFELQLAPVAATPDAPPGPPATQAKAALDGMFPTSRWHPGEFVKIELQLKPAATWAVTSAALRLRVLDGKNQPLALTGGAVDESGSAARGGTLPVAPKAPAAPGPAPTPAPLAPPKPKPAP